MVITMKNNVKEDKITTELINKNFIIVPKYNLLYYKYNIFI